MSPLWKALYIWRTTFTFSRDIGHPVSRHGKQTRAAVSQSLPDRTVSVEGGADTEQQLRERAVERLKKKRDFITHVFIYVAVNAFLVAIWAVTGAGYFWPIFPILGWGIAVIANAWDVYGRKPISEDAIRREADRLRGPS
jgi:2TM domain